ncbi:Rid family detoxifying hydrolase [Paenarthrobacter sp. NPDC092416]|uniref:Rid family detoxifying hydrolase n=1 Tax=Paenarthrobacter sp. NPDC092416 TaxID=3364386 RepID=UPI00380481AC
MDTTRATNTISRIATDTAPPAAGPYAQAIRHGNILYVSGQLPINPRTLVIERPNDASAQTRQILENISSILNQAGSSLRNVIKATIFLTRIEDFADVNRIYGQAFNESFPARSCIAVSALPHPDALVEIEVTAALDLASPLEAAL